MSAQDGLDLAYRDYGDALAPRLPVLCLPGLTRNAKDFHGLAERLAAQRRVLCPDYRGRGRSAYDPDWSHYTPQYLMLDLLHLLAAANLHRGVVVGTSFGGLLAMGLATVAAHAVAGVVLHDIGPEVEATGQARILDYIGRDHPQTDWPSAAAHLKDAFGYLRLPDDAAWLDLARATFREGADGLLHVDWDVNLARPLRQVMAEAPDLWGLFRALGDVPVLAIRGAESDILSAATVERMAARHRDLVAVTVPGAGHPPLLSDAIVAEAIDAFLARF